MWPLCILRDQDSSKVKDLPNDTAILSVRIMSKTKAHIKGIPVLMFVVVLFTVAKIYSQSTCL